MVMLIGGSDSREETVVNIDDKMYQFIAKAKDKVQKAWHPSFYKFQCSSKLHEPNSETKVIAHICDMFWDMPFGHGGFFADYKFLLHSDYLNHIKLQASQLMFNLIWDELLDSEGWLSCSKNWKEDDRELVFRRDEAFISLDTKRNIIHIASPVVGINPHFDIDSNEEDLITFLEWIQEGGQFPLLLPSFSESLEAFNNNQQLKQIIPSVIQTPMKARQWNPDT